MIWTEGELIRIGDGQPLLDGAAVGVQENQFVAGGIADNQAFAVGCRHDVVRLAQNRDAADFLQGCHVDDADLRRGGIDDVGNALCLGLGSAKKERKQQKAHQTHRAVLRRKSRDPYARFGESGKADRARLNSAAASVTSTHMGVEISTLSVIACSASAT